MPTTRSSDFSPMAVRRVLHALGAQLGASACFGLAPGSPPVWAEVAAELGLAVGTRGSPAVRVVPLADRVTDNDADRWTLEVISGTEVVAIGTVHPAAAGPGQVGRWPAGWADLFAVHGWRFVDVLRPMLWDDGDLPLKAREGWLVFVAPGCRPELVASPALPIVHPDRLVAGPIPVDTDVESLRQEFQSGLRRVAHRRELEALRHRVDETMDTLHVREIQYEAVAARLAATERRVMLLLEQSLGLWQPPAPSETAPSQPRGRRHLLLAALRRSGVPALPKSPSRSLSPVALTLFDNAEYVAAHPDSAADPLGHYLRVGEPMGYRPNRWFDPLYYLQQNLDVRSAGVSPLLHFADHGAAEGRDPSEEFDLRWYLGTYPEVRATGMNPLLHFIAVGQALGYETGPPTRPARLGSAPA